GQQGVGSTGPGGQCAAGHPPQTGKAFFRASWAPLNPAAGLDPCGTIMDMIRTEYTQNMLVYTDVSTPIRVKWYRAHPKAKPIRPYTIFGASSRSGYKDPPLGEVSNLDLYIRGSWGNFGGYLGQNTCGPPGAFQRG